MIALARGGLAAVLLALAISPVAGGPIATASKVHVSGTDSSARFRLELSREVEYHIFALADPYRVVIDLPEVEFRLPEEAGRSREGLIRAFRYGLFSPGKSRIVIDVGAPVSIVEPYVIPPVGSGPALLEVGLKRTSREDFMRDFALNNRRAPAAPQAVAPQPAPDINSLIQPRETSGRMVIVIDPGHGGIDPGTRGPGGVVEKDIVLAFSRKLRDGLKARGDVDVHMTRNSDTFVPLRERREFARTRQADLFISVHADAVTQGDATGATVYTLSDRASDEVAAALAAKENKSDLIAGVSLDEVSSEVGGILVELAQRETNTFSMDFAESLVKALRQRVRVNRNPMRSASFVVLKSHDVPSVLVELGFLSNSRDAESLKSSVWRQKAVSATADAVEKFFGTRLAGADRK